MTGKTKKIYVVDTKAPTYEMRHLLYDLGVRWDAKRGRWWGTRLATVRRAVELVGDKNAKALPVHVQALPSMGKTYRGGRPRAPRNKAKATRLAQTHRMAVSVPVGELPPVVPVGAPIVRQTVNEERRQGPPADRDRQKDAQQIGAMLKLGPTQCWLYQSRYPSYKRHRNMMMPTLNGWDDMPEHIRDMERIHNLPGGYVMFNAMQAVVQSRVRLRRMNQRVIAFKLRFPGVYETLLES
jgi:hypothetical protein